MPSAARRRGRRLSSPSSPSSDAIPAADSIPDSGVVLDEASSGDLSALANTVNSGQSPTPLADDQPIVRRRHPPTRRRSWPVVAAVVAALWAGVAYLLMQYGGF